MPRPLSIPLTIFSEDHSKWLTFMCQIDAKPEGILKPSPNWTSYHCIMHIVTHRYVINQGHHLKKNTQRVWDKGMHKDSNRHGDGFSYVFNVFIKPLPLVGPNAQLSFSWALWPHGLLLFETQLFLPFACTCTILMDSNAHHLIV